MKQLPNRIFTVSEAETLGVPRWKLAELVKAGTLRRVSRGVYAPIGAYGERYPEIVTLVRKGYSFVIALESALVMHEFASFSPHELWIAVKRGTRIPKVDFPLRALQIKEEQFACGIEKWQVDGVCVCVYSAARTVADMFKFRNVVGVDAATSALKEGLRNGRFTVDELLKCASVDRVSNVILPYVEGYFA